MGDVATLFTLLQSANLSTDYGTISLRIAECGLRNGTASREPRAESRDGDAGTRRNGEASNLRLPIVEDERAAAETLQIANCALSPCLLDPDGATGIVNAERVVLQQRGPDQRILRSRKDEIYL